MKRLFMLVIFCTLLCRNSYSLPFTSGNIVVVRVGDGNAALTSNATAVFLDEYTTSGVLIQSIPLPTTVNGSNLRCTITGTSISEGTLNLSGNRAFLTLAGYNQEVGTSVTATSSSTIQRVVARIDENGGINTSTGLTDAYNGNASISANFRSAITMDGSAFWLTGSGSGAAGIRYTTLGATTTTLLASSPTNLRCVSIAGSQLYVSSETTGYYGVSTVGSGTPTSSGQTVSVLPGFPTASASNNPSAYAFDMQPITKNILYVADDRTPANGGGIQKWVYSNNTWTLAYTIPLSGTANISSRGLTVDWRGSSPIIYATGAVQINSTPANSIYKIVDNGDVTSSTVTAIATTATNTYFRGIAFAPNTMVLPLQLLSFSASIKENTVAFAWETENERNTHHFEIEQSFDGRDFKSVATVAAAGNSSVTKSYSHTGILPAATTYYRLKMVDADSKSTTSSVVKISPSKTGFSLGNVYPIPAKNSVTVEWSSNHSGATRLVLTDISGRIMRTINLQSNQGFNQYTLDINALTSGQYFLRLKDDMTQLQTIITKQ